MPDEQIIQVAMDLRDTWPTDMPLRMPDVDAEAAIAGEADVELRAEQAASADPLLDDPLAELEITTSELQTIANEPPPTEDELLYGPWP